MFSVGCLGAVTKRQHFASFQLASVRPSRWTTSNQYTTFSCNYPDAFGVAVGYAAFMLGFEKQCPTDAVLSDMIESTAKLIANRLPPVEVLKKEADLTIEPRLFEQMRLKCLGPYMFSGLGPNQLSGFVCEF